MDCREVDTRWWNLSATVVAASIVGCGPTVVLIGDTEADSGGPDDGGETADDGIDPTGGMIGCANGAPCPEGLVCIDNQCIEENVDYSDYNDEYNDEYVDYSDYNDEFYCYEYGPKGECCDYYECPQQCGEPDDCDTGQLCLPDEGGASYCVVPGALPDCDAPEFIAIVADDAMSEVVSLAFVDVDPAAGQELVIGRAEGGADILIAGVPQPLMIDPAAVMVDAASGDVNGDTFPDLIVSDNDEATVLFGDGMGTFTPAFAITGFGQLADLAVVDFTGEGEQDIVARTVGGQSVVFVNDGSGLLYSAVLLDATELGDATSLTTGFFDGPTQPLDAFVTTTDGDALFYGAGKAPKSVAPDVTGILIQPQGTRTAYSGDFGVPGIEALVTVTPRGSWTLLESLGPDGVMQYATFVEATGVGLGDVYGNGAPDLVLVGADLYFARGIPGPEDAQLFDCFTGIKTISDDNIAVAVGDFDGNGIADVALSDGGPVNIFTGI